MFFYLQMSFLIIATICVGYGNKIRPTEGTKHGIEARTWDKILIES